MTNKSNFTPAEWKVLLQSMIAAGTAVTAADPSGLWGLLKESFAGGTALAKANSDGHSPRNWLTRPPLASASHSGVMCRCQSWRMSNRFAALNASAPGAISMAA
jgi:hypothetical protein